MNSETLFWIEKGKSLGWRQVHFCEQNDSQMFGGKVIGQEVEGGAFHEVPPLDAIEKLLAELLLNFPVNERAIKEKILAVWKAGHEQGVSDTLTNMRERFEELASQKKSE